MMKSGLARGIKHYDYESDEKKIFILFFLPAFSYLFIPEFLVFDILSFANFVSSQNNNMVRRARAKKTNHSTKGGKQLKLDTYLTKSSSASSTTVVSSRKRKKNSTEEKTRTVQPVVNREENTENDDSINPSAVWMLKRIQGDEPEKGQLAKEQWREHAETNLTALSVQKMNLNTTMREKSTKIRRQYARKRAKK